MAKTYHGTIKLPSKPLTIDLEAPSEYFNGQTKQFLMSDDGGDRLISVTFDGKKATIPAVKGTGKLMIYFMY